MLARIRILVLSILVVSCTSWLSGCCSRSCKMADGGGGEGDLLLRGHAVFAEAENDQYDIRLYLYGIDSLDRSPANLVQLVEVNLYGMPGEVPISKLGGKDTFLGRITANELDGSHVALGRAGRMTWEAKPSQLDPKLLKVAKSGVPKFTVLGKFKFSSSQGGVTKPLYQDRWAVVKFVKASKRMYMQVVPPAGNGDVITKLSASGTFHAPQNQALFDLIELTYTGTAGRIEVFAAPPGTDDLFTAAHRIHTHLGATVAPYSATGLVAPYDGSDSWRFGARVTVAQVPNTLEGLFVDLASNPGTATSINE